MAVNQYRCAACGAQFADAASGERHSARFTGCDAHIVSPAGSPSNPDAYQGDEMQPTQPGGAGVDQ